MWPFGRKSTPVSARRETSHPHADPRFVLAPDPARRPRLSNWRWKFKVFVVAPAAIALVATTALGLLFVHYTTTFPNPLSLRHKERAPIIRIMAADGSVLAERGAAHDYMPLDLLPRHVTDAVVATEDRRFYEHGGLDPQGLVRAMFANMRAGRYAQGGSTLTQQLAKNLFLTSERTIGRKVEELALAIWLEMRLSKQDILELYLNRVYFGAGAYGIEAAAQRYFDKSARNLSLGEAAVIAGLLKAPSKYSPLTSPGAARARGRVVLKKMLAAHAIDTQAEADAGRQIVRFAVQRANKESTGVEYAVDFVLERLPPLLGNGHAEVIVETTIDAKLQRRAQAVVEEAIAREGETAHVGQAAVVVLDMEGGITALVGGRSFAESQFNRAVKSRRQPGSSFKPFVYLAALEAGYTPDSTVYDLPVTIDGWTPRNDGGQYRGAMTLRQAITHSINSVAARLQYDVGVKKVIAVARRLGITSELRRGPSLALGTSEVSLLEMTGSYTAFANGGHRVDPHIIKRVRISSGRVLYARPPATADIAIAPANVGAMNDMLNAALVKGTGRQAGFLLHPSAGKTGTTQDFRDAWFIGYTAHLAGGVWVGNDHGRAMNNVKGGSLPATIWRQIMSAAHENRAIVALPGTVMPAAEAAPQRPAATATAHDDPIATQLMQSSGAAQPHAKRDDAYRRPARAQGPMQPSEPIDGDLIARALAEPDPAEPAVTVARAERRWYWPFGGRDSGSKPDGMMALGGKRQ